MGAGMLDTVRELLTGDADPMVVSNCMSVIQKVAPLLSQCMRARSHASWVSSGTFRVHFPSTGTRTSRTPSYIEDCRGRPLWTFGFLILSDIDPSRAYGLPTEEVRIANRPAKRASQQPHTKQHQQRSCCLTAPLPHKLQILSSSLTTSAPWKTLPGQTLAITAETPPVIMTKKRIA